MCEENENNDKKYYVDDDDGNIYNHSFYVRSTFASPRMNSPTTTTKSTHGITIYGSVLSIDGTSEMTSSGGVHR